MSRPMKTTIMGHPLTLGFVFIKKLFRYFFVLIHGDIMSSIKPVTFYYSTTENGYEQNIKKYQAQNCNGCPLRGVCHQSKTNRTIEINHELVRLKNKAKANLLSETGIEHRKKRCYTIEPVFACIKQNKNFKRFNLRSLPKVNIEAGLCLIGFNIKQKAILMQQKRA